MDKLKVGELKQELQKRGLSYLGKKSELHERLGRAMVDKIGILNLAASAAALTSFDTNARWRLLTPTIEVNEPINIEPTLVDPSRVRDQRNKKSLSAEIVEVKKLRTQKSFIRKNLMLLRFKLLPPPGAMTVKKERNLNLSKDTKSFQLKNCFLI